MTSGLSVDQILVMNGSNSRLEDLAKLANIEFYLTRVSVSATL